MRKVALKILLLAMAIGWTSEAWAVPAFARKYGTSCQTCHTIYPKLTPFGEAFRRNGFRFPGTDSDFIKQEQIALGQEAQKQSFPNSVWPSSLGAVPFAFAFDGQATIHPDKNAGGAAADNQTGFTAANLVGEAHMWAAGAFDDKRTYFGQVTFSSAGTVAVEQASIYFNDIIGPPHLLNLMVGKNIPTLSSFGWHSSYIVDQPIVSLSTTALMGGTGNAWALGGEYNGLELTGTVNGRFIYSAGYNAGAQLDIRADQDAYAHIGTKIGGMRLDGEGGGGIPNPNKPWAERALTLDAFGYHSSSRFTNSAGGAQNDLALAFGGSFRAQLDSLELDSGIYSEQHKNATSTGAYVHGLVQYNELSYVIFPWLVPAVRVEYLQLGVGSAADITDLRIMPGIAFSIFPNLQFRVIGQIERAVGAPPAGWSAAGGFANPSTPTTIVPGEVEAIFVNFAFAI